MRNLGLPEGYSAFQHLVLGLHNAWGKHQKLMAIYSAYFDESGHETSDIFGCGGLVIDAEDPLAFDSAWKQAIHPLTYLHTADFIAGRKDFSEWHGKTSEKIDILSRAVKIISDVSFQTLSCVLLMDDYRRADQKIHFSESIAYPFALCARFCSVQVNHWAARNSIPGPVKLYFEDRPEGLGEVMEVFKRDEIPTPNFESKTTLPTQAADLIAWASCAKVLNSPAWSYYKEAFSGLPACLHTHDIISYDTLLQIARNARNISGLEIPFRPSANDVFAFHSSGKRLRKQFS
jgi:hypothetical protein